MFEQSAAETGGSRLVRFVTDPACELSVLDVAVSPSGAGNFGQMISEMRAQGLDEPWRKYLVWMDANVYCGIAQEYLDDDKNPDNLSNGSSQVLGMFGRIDNGCWGALDNGGSHLVEAHELMHTLGAVNSSAPNATPYGHCTDESDTMCYRDGPGVTVRQVCPPAHEALFDCNHDDYFSTDPAPGSYLSDHWNTANSVFLSGSVAPRPPTASSSTTTIAARPASVPADGSSSSMITVQARDANGTNLPSSGGVVTISTTNGTLSATADNRDGTYTARLTAPAKPGQAQITGTIAGRTIDQALTVTFSPRGTCVVPRARGGLLLRPKCRSGGG